MLGPCHNLAVPATCLKSAPLQLSHEQVRSIANQFGTPLYVFDEQSFRLRIREYRQAFSKAYKRSEINFASKSNSTHAILAIAAQEGCFIDVASEGELRAAERAGISASQCNMHGNNKSAGELSYAVKQGVRQIIIDNFDELELLNQILISDRTKLVLRLAPSVDPITHEKLKVGQAVTKFGFNIANGSADSATKYCLDKGLPLIGYHSHVGSQLLDPLAQKAGGEALAGFAMHVFKDFGFAASLLNLGGGLGVSYLPEQKPVDIDTYCQMVVDAVVSKLEGSGLNPTLAQEPGRSLAAESGVTIYRVGPIKTVPKLKGDTVTFVNVDGGLSDNPRPGLYGGEYSISLTKKNEKECSSTADKVVTVCGKHCEADILFPDKSLPDDIQSGDFLQVFATGAYNSSMASNYNRFARPATVLIDSKDKFQIIQTRETWDQMFARELMPEALK